MPYLLITTSCSLLLVETLSSTCYCIDTGREHYFGIARNLGGYFIGVRCRANTSTIPKEEERGKILCLNATGVVVDELEPSFPMRDIHQILVCDGRLWVTCTYDNMIAIFDGNSWEAWYPLGIPNDVPRDINHFNSLAVFGNTLCVVAHNLSANTGKPSELLFYLQPDMVLEKRIELGNCAHNAWLHRGELMTCSSADGCLIGIDGSRIDTGGFPRGISYSRDEINVGISEFANRPDRDLGKGWLKIFDYNWNLLRTLEIENQGMVTDVYSLTSKDAELIISNNNINKVDSIKLI